MTRSDAHIARQWAEGFIKHAGSAQIVDADALTAARHILATTTPPTMADIAWDNEVHAGLCAESTDDGVVRMIGPDWVGDHADHIMCYLGDGNFDSLPFASLTPIPGTSLDLTPRRESVPESTSEHPTTLTTEEDYENAPQGTIVAGDHAVPWFKHYLGFWLACGVDDVETSAEMPLAARRVLRWGETL